MLKPRLIGPPSQDLLDLADVKAHLRIEHPDDDALLSSLILAAQSHLDGRDGIMGRALVNQVWRSELNAWPPSGHVLPLPDVSSCAVSYFDAQNVLRAVAASDVRIIEKVSGSAIEFDVGFSFPDLYPRLDAIRFDMTCGYGPEASDVPADIRQAARMMIAAWHANPEGVMAGQVQELPVPAGVMILLAKHRYRGII